MKEFGKKTFNFFPLKITNKIIPKHNQLIQFLFSFLFLDSIFWIDCHSPLPFQGVLGFQVEYPTFFSFYMSKEKSEFCFHFIGQHSDIVKHLLLADTLITNEEMYTLVCKAYPFFICYMCQRLLVIFDDIISTTSYYS